MRHKKLVKLSKSMLAFALTAAMVFTSNMGTLTAQAASSPEELEPILFTIDKVVGQPGESVKLNINASMGSGFSGAMGEVITADGISVSAAAKGEFGGTMYYSKSSKSILYLTGDGCNVYGDGVFGKLKINIPEDAEPGIYSVDWNLEQLSYAYEDLSGQTLYPAQKIRVSPGSVTVPATYEKNYVFAVANKEIEAGTTADVDVYVKNPTGFESVTATFAAEGGIEVANFTSDEGLTKFTKSTAKGVFVTKDTKNKTDEGTFAKLTVKVPEGTPAGAYKITMTTEKVTYAYRNGSGYETVPEDKITTVVGTITVPKQVSEPELPEFGTYAFLVGSDEVKAGQIAELTIDVKQTTGFTGFNATIDAQGLAVADLTSDIALTKFDKKTCKGVFVTKDVQNLLTGGKIAKIMVLVPKGTPAGEYPVSLNITSLKYSVDDETTAEIPLEKVKTITGTIKVVEENIDPDANKTVFTFPNIEVKAGEEAEVEVALKNPNGFGGIYGSMVTEGGIEVIDGYAWDIEGQVTLSNGIFYYLSNSGKDVHEDNCTAFMFDIRVPADTPAGTYAISFDITELYKEAPSGRLVKIPLENMKVNPGTITVLPNEVVPPTEEPTTEEPTTEEPTTEEPTTEEPTTEEPTTEQPTTEQPTSQEPTSEEPSSQPVDENSDLNVTTKVNNWGSGYQVQIKVANETSRTVDGWTIKINKNDIDIDASWSVNVAEEGNYYVITPVEWNKTLAPGASTEFGLQGSGKIADKIEILVNGKSTEEPATEEPTTEEPTTEEPTTEAPTTEEPTTEEPTTEAPTTEAPTTEEPTTEEPSADVVTLSDVEFGKAIDLSAYNYNNIKKVVVKFAGNADQYSGAVVLGDWNQQVSFESAILTDNTVTVEVTSPQAVLNVYKWWSSTTLEIESIDLIY